MHDDLTPRERLAKIVAEETGDGRRIVRFLVQVAEGGLHSEGFKPCHRMDSAKELVKVGLTEFSDYIRANSTPPKPRAERTSRPDADLSPEIAEAREQLAAYARELTQDGRTVIKMYAEVMEGARNDEGFKPHHRIAAARELIKRGFDYECDHATPTVVPAKAGTQQAPGHVMPEAHLEPTTESAELITDNSELKIDEEEPVDYLAIVKRVVESLGPIEEEEEDESGHKPDYSMWDEIMEQPQPEITEEHIRIGAALFDEAVERQRIWRLANAKTPTRKDHDSYDDG